jgi:hypothetical protein
MTDHVHIQESTADEAIAKLLALEARKYQLLNQAGGINMQGLLARISSLEAETENLKSTCVPEEDGIYGSAPIIELSSDTDTSSATTTKTNRPSFSAKMPISTSSLLNTRASMGPVTPTSHPLSSTGGTPVTRKHKTASLPHGFTIRPVEGTQDSQTAINSSARPTSTMHPLARANNYNAGSNEVFQPFMYKQKRRPSVNSVAFSNAHTSVGPALAHGDISDETSGQKWLKGSIIFMQCTVIFDDKWDFCVRRVHNF